GSITLKTTDAPISQTVGLFMSAAGGGGGAGGAGGNGDNLGNGQGTPTVSDQTHFVNALYSGVLGRTGDSDGVDYWLQQIATGSSRGEIAQSFWESSEHRGLQVDDFYATYLHRAADPDSRQFWIGIFATGASETQVQL